MAIAVVHEFELRRNRRDDDVSAAHVKARLNVAGDPPTGLIAHTTRVTANGTLRLFDVWASRSDWERFRDERLLPATKDVATSDTTYLGELDDAA